MTLRWDYIDPETGRPMYEVCRRCNYDRHICPGCGANLSHGVEVCPDCDARIRRENFYVVR